MKTYQISLNTDRLGSIECQLEVPSFVLRVQGLKWNLVRKVSVKEGTEGEAIVP